MKPALQAYKCVYAETLVEHLLQDPAATSSAEDNVQLCEAGNASWTFSSCCSCRYCSVLAEQPWHYAQLLTNTTPLLIIVHIHIE